MRVLHVVTRSHLRGAEMAALDLSDELRHLGHANRVVALSPGFDGTEEERIPVLVDSPLLRRFPFLEHCRAMADELRWYRPDVILAHGGAATRVAAFSRRSGWPLVVWQRILQFPDGALESRHGFLWRVVVHRVDAAVALTPRNDGELLHLGFRGPVWQIPNSRRAARFAELDDRHAETRLRHELGLDDTVPLIGLVGHLIEQKRPERAVHVLAGVRAAGVPAHLVIAGGGPLRDVVADEVQRAGLQDHVSFLGVRRDIPELLSSLDLLIITSDAEGIPGVIIEAGMSGCVVVSFPFDGADEIANDGAIVLDRPDIPVMVGVAAEVLQDRDRLVTMAAAAKDAAMRLSTEEVAHQYAQRLEALLERHRRHLGTPDSRFAAAVSGAPR